MKWTSYNYRRVRGKLGIRWSDEIIKTGGTFYGVEKHILKKDGGESARG